MTTTYTRAKDLDMIKPSLNKCTICVHSNCKKPATHGYIHHPKTRCNEHKTKNMIFFQHSRGECIHVELGKRCKRNATHAYPFSKIPVFCAVHSHKHMLPISDCLIVTSKKRGDVMAKFEEKHKLCLYDIAISDYKNLSTCKDDKSSMEEEDSDDNEDSGESEDSEYDEDSEDNGNRKKRQNTEHRTRSARKNDKNTETYGKQKTRETSKQKRSFEKIEKTEKTNKKKKDYNAHNVIDLDSENETNSIDQKPEPKPKPKKIIYSSDNSYDGYESEDLGAPSTTRAIKQTTQPPIIRQVTPDPQTFAQICSEPPLYPMLQMQAPPQPTPQLMPQPMPQPMLQPMPQPMLQPMPQPMLQPMPQPMLQPMPQPMLQPMPQYMQHSMQPMIMSTIYFVPMNQNQYFDYQRMQTLSEIRNHQKETSNDIMPDLKPAPEPPKQQQAPESVPMSAPEPPKQQQAPESAPMSAPELPKQQQAPEPPKQQQAPKSAPESPKQQQAPKSAPEPPKQQQAPEPPKQQQAPKSAPQPESEKHETRKSKVLRKTKSTSQEQPQPQQVPSPNTTTPAPQNTEHTRYYPTIDTTKSTLDWYNEIMNDYLKTFSKK